ncbi:MAG TPA: YfhO family protein [Actinomycetota bacterium]|nr:YfhO family protein [Actinomycetota bacterium]
MRTAEREGHPEAAAGTPAATLPRRLMITLGGPALIVVSVLIALRGFAFANLLTDQHPDVLSFWLPRSCLMGRALADGHLPLWNPYEMLGTPFLADSQSGWLSLPTMLLSWLLGCGGGLRAIVVLNPILAGLGTYWFLRREGLWRIPATAGGLSIAMTMAASSVAISLPFAGTLAWTPFVLVGASGYLAAERLLRRLGWLALGAVAWGQVALSHMSHGLVICTALTFAYLAARSIHDVRTGRRRWPHALALAGAFLAFLPLANLAILVPRFALISRSSLRAGYGALGGTLARAAGIRDRPIPDTGIWSGWPFAFASTPGAYVGAAMLLLAPMAFRDRTRRALTLAFTITAVVGYLATITLLVGNAWLRDLVVRLPYGDVYLHNPGRLRYLAILVLPVLGALGVQSLLERPPSARQAVRWVGGAAAVVLVLPFALGAKPERFVVIAAGTAAMALVVRWTLRRRRWAALALVAVLTAELLANAIWSSVYQGGTVYLGLEGRDNPVLLQGPLRWPNAPLDEYLTPGPIARRIATTGGNTRYLAWIQPTVYFNKGYLFTQDRADWPALLLGRAIAFRLHDVLGYSPIQLPRYWSYIRATNRLPVFYNASILQVPSDEDLRLLGVRFMIVPQGVAPPVPAREILSENGYTLVEIEGWQPRVSVVPTWETVRSGVPALEAVLERGFDPAVEAVVEGDPGIEPVTGEPPPGTARYDESTPEDVRIAVDAPAPSIVVVRNAWDRGWSATVDGEPAPVLRTDYLLQGVPVPAGEHEVRLLYREPAIGRGLALSAVVWLGFLAILGWALVRSRRDATPPSPPSDA